MSLFYSVLTLFLEASYKVLSHYKRVKDYFYKVTIKYF